MEDERLVWIKDRNNEGKAPDFQVDKDGVLWFKKRLCVPKKGHFRRTIVMCAKGLRQSTRNPVDYSNRCQFQYGSGMKLVWILSPVYREPRAAMTRFG
jgi:hypothetical protein